MEVKVYKSIFRMDYPLSYKIVDRLGQQLEEIIEHTKEKPFEECAGNLDLINHAVQANGKINNGKYTINLSIKSFDGSIETPDGFSINRLQRNPIFGVADKILSDLGIESFKKFHRIGFRSFIIITADELSFDKVLAYFKKITSPLTSLLEDNFSVVDDAGVVLESFDEEIGNIRLSIGPFGEKDKRMYFTVEPEVKEGILLDIDWWDEKVEIPGIKITEMVKTCQHLYNNLISGIEKGILKEIGQ